MADVGGKRYYWLKLKSDFFESKQMKKLRKIASGTTYMIVYLKLQLLSLKTDGKLYFDGVEDTFAEELALEINEGVDDVKATIVFLQKFGLLEAESETEYFLPIVPTLVGSEDDRTNEIREQTRQRVAKHREKKRLETSSNADVTLPVTLPVTDSNALEIEKRDREKREEKEREPEKRNSASASQISEEFNFSRSVREAFGRYLSYLSETGKPAGTESARALAKKLQSIAHDDVEAVEILETTIRKRWKDIYAPDRPKNQSPAVRTFGDYEQRKTNYSEIEKMMYAADDKGEGFDEE